MEKWKSVIGYENLYEISDFGNFRSLDKLVAVRNGNRKWNVWKSNQSYRFK